MKLEVFLTSESLLLLRLARGRLPWADDTTKRNLTGKLRRLVRMLHQLNVSVDLAKISTNFDQVVDVYDLTEQDGRRVTDEA